VFVKPRWGTGSLGLYRADDRDRLLAAHANCVDSVAASDLATFGAHEPGREVLVQTELSGEEFGLDVINDLDGRYVTTFVKRKLRMRAGQTDRAVTVNRPDLLAVGEAVGRAVGHPGMLDCDVIVVDDVAYVLDLNPRIGGGYPFSHRAGADYPAALLAWARRLPVDPSWLSIVPEVTVATADRHVVVPMKSNLPRDDSARVRGIGNVGPTMLHGQARGLWRTES
jgi:carbamoyl-phosphate synthase large subunit